MNESEITVHTTVIEEGVTYCLEDECPDDSYDVMLRKTLGDNWEDELCD